MNQIPSNWETNRLFIRNAVLEEDLKNLQQLWESTSYLGEFDGHSGRNHDDMYRDLTDGDLPPGGTKERFKIQPFFSKEASEMIGYIAMYHGYPSEESLWITFFYVNTSVQKQGYGHELIEQFAVEAKKTGYRSISLTVALKNWEAIRFWTRAGFDKVTGVYGDETYSTNTFAHLALEKSLC